MVKLGGKKSRPKQFVDVDDSAGVLAELILKSIGQARHKEVGPADIRRGRHKEVGPVDVAATRRWVAVSSCLRTTHVGGSYFCTHAWIKTWI